MDTRICWNPIYRGSGFIFGACILLLPQLARATSYTWDGSSQGTGIHLWGDANNWTPAGVPGVLDTAILTNVSSGASVLNLQANRTLGRLSYRGSFNPQISGGTLTLTDAIEVTNGISIGGINDEIDPHIIAPRTIVSGNATLTVSNPLAHFGTFVLNGGALFASQQSIANPITLDSLGGTLKGTPNVTGAISGTGMLIVDGNVSASGLNTYQGGTMIDSGGQLKVGTDSALGWSGTPITLKNGSVLKISGNMSNARPIQLASVYGYSKEINTQAYTLIHSGTIRALGVNPTLEKTGTGSLILQGVPNDHITLVASQGLVVLDKSVGATSNDFGAAAGDIIIGGAATIVRSGQDEQIADHGRLSITDGTFDLSQHTETVGSLYLKSGHVVGSLGSALRLLHQPPLGIISSGQSTVSIDYLRVNSDTMISVEEGSLVLDSVLANAIQGQPSVLTKTGSGAIILTKPSDYMGEIRINSGPLVVSTNIGSATGSGDVTVSDMGLLTGSGTIGGNVVLQSGGNILPGATFGMLSIGGNLTQGWGASIGVELGGTNPNEFDTVRVTGTADLAGALTISLVNGFHPPLGSEFSILTAGHVLNHGISLSGDATGFQLIESSHGLRLRYVGTDVPADLNHDGSIDAADAAALFANWGHSGSGDLNADTIVDAADAGEMFAAWTGDAVTSVPEPAFPPLATRMGIALGVYVFERRRAGRRSRIHFLPPQLG